MTGWSFFPYLFFLILVSLKTSYFMFIGCYNVWLGYYHVFLTSSVYAPSWSDDVRACSLNFFIISTTYFQTKVVVFLLMYRAYFCPYVVPSLIRVLYLCMTCFFIFLLPLYPRWSLSLLPLSPRWILFLLCFIQP